MSIRIQSEKTKFQEEVKRMGNEMTKSEELIAVGSGVIVYVQERVSKEC